MTPTDVSVRDAAATAVMATLPLLPLTGSWNSGYRVSDRIDTTLMAEAEEWASAALAIAELHAVLAGRSGHDR